jgi:small subunit ribosomal protein S13
MARISGVDLPRNKRVEIALQYIYGIGKTRAKEIVEKAGFDKALRTDALTDEHVAKLRSIIEGQWKVEGDLRR